jgi:ABC-2 type transport system permease protein
MRNVLAITQKELKVYFTSPIAYVVMAVFLLIAGYLYYNIVTFALRQSVQMMQFQGALPQVNVNELILRPTLHNLAVIMILTLPLLTMRLIAEERRARTAELLMTSPLTITAIIVGKYLGALIVLALMLALTLFMPLLLDLFGDVSWAPVLTGYLGLLMLGAVFISVGLLASSVTENQIVAGVLGFGLVLLLWLMGWLSQALSETGFGELFTFLSVGEHFQSFVKGLVRTEDVVYLLSLAVLGLFLTHRVIESERWK